ncbi:helix-turn-helix domain-containing protein [Gorillibacterium sp. sgz5001074]|uniref:helix-turn-helix domain-containing protein n=1 Tax=Gorillibacterium sp. sgz5001074 TaxID=3446695 RepID=UPI003F6622C9
MDSGILHFLTPPIPYFIDCGLAVFEAGECHISRNQMGSFDLIVVTKGTLPIGEADSSWELTPGEALILRPDAHHYGTRPCEASTEFIWIHFHTFGAWGEYPDMEACLAQGEMLIGQHKESAYLNHCEVNSIFIPKHLRVSAKTMEILDDFRALEHEPRSLRNWKRQNTFQSFLQHVDLEIRSASDTTAFQLAEKVELFIRRHYKTKLTNSYLQRELNYHPNYMAKCMLKIFGKTPMEYLMHYRIEQAKKLLIQTEWPMSRIAEEVGFPHASYFTHCFSTREGTPPLSFRKKYKNL